MENKIKESLEAYQIKTTSKDILSKAYKPRFFKFKLLPLMPVFACLMIMLSLIFVIMNKTPSIKPIKGTTNGLNDSSIIGELSFELYFGCMINETTTSKKKNLSNVDAFKKAIDEIHQNFLVVNSLYQNKSGLDYTYTKSNFKYNNKTYIACLKVDDYLLYLTKQLTNEEIEDQDVLIKICDIYINGQIDVEIEEDEIELTLSYVFNNHLIKIEKEVEADEYFYAYNIYENDTVIESKEIKVENDLEDNELEIEFRQVKNNVLITLEITKENNIYLLNYLKETKEEKTEIKDIEIKIDKDFVAYEYEDEIILKNF